MVGFFLFLEIIQNSQLKMSSTAASKRKRLICVSLPTKAKETAMKRQFPSAEIIVGAISCRKGISSGTREIANCLLVIPHGHGAARCEKTSSCRHIFLPWPVRISKPHPRSCLYAQPIFEINFPDPG